MTKDTMTVKELSGELQIPVKEVLQLLQQFGVEAKNGSSSIASELRDRVRNHVKGKNKTDVIVRRRKVADVPHDQQDTEHHDGAPNVSTQISAVEGTHMSSSADVSADTASGTLGQTPVDASTKMSANLSPETSSDANADASAASSTAQDANASQNKGSASTQGTKSQGAKSRGKGAATAPPARIISPAPSAVHGTAQGATQTEETVAAQNAQSVQSNVATDPSTPAHAPVDTSTTDTAQSAHTTTPSTTSAPAAASTQEAGKTVQHVQENNAPVAAQVQDSAAKPVAGDAPVAQNHATTSNAPENTHASSVKNTEPTAGSDGKQPDASAHASPATSAQDKQKQEAQGQESQGQETQAKEGQGDAAQQDRSGRKRDRNKKRQPPVQAAPQVRVISRPAPETSEQRAARMQAAQNAGGAAGSRDNRGGRPDNRQDGRQDNRPDNRPDNRYGGRGQDGRPQHDNRGAPRPQRPGQQGHQGQGQDNRPPRPHGQGPAGGRGGRPDAPAGGFATPDAVGEGQSKKKRMKGRRTVDFQQGGEFERFGHDDDNAMRLGRHKGRRGNKKDMRPATATQPLKATKRKIRVTEAIRVADMAHQMGLKSNEIIKVLFGLGIMATINQSLDIDTATLVAAEFNYEVEKAGFSEEDYLIPTQEDSAEDLRPRPPVVTIMGHVDHGKTSLLDAIRKSNLTSGEAGGITQYIGAYHVTTERGEIVFLDTPGHDAFTAMRARGAQVTDLVILVVAADDGVMEQTREAINHSKAAGVPIMVAVNKMDKPAAQPDRVLRELAELGLQAEDWGGDTVTAMVSAKSRQGLDELLELVALQAEILELKANPNKAARGRIVEAKLDKGRGPVATVLIQEGTLRQGDTFVCGVFSGRVRALFNDQGKKVKEAGPSIPVEVQGFDGVPLAGEEFVCVADDKLARRIAETRATKQRERDLAKESKVTLETFLSRRASDQETLTLNLVLKADVQGTLGAITEALNKKSTDKVRINVVHGGAGAISESDILLASASHAIIIGFNVRPTAKIKEVAEHEGVDIRYYDIIYKLAEDVTRAMQGMLAPVQKEQYLGQAEVRDIFSVPKIGVIAGCHVADGKMARHAGVRLLRDGVVVYTGKINSLKRFKDDAKEVMKGYECGIGLENFNDIKTGDVIEAFEMIEEAATL